ncbi:MAG: EF-hand domain-containing protein [Sphingomonas bacterium]
MRNLFLAAAFAGSMTSAAALAGQTAPAEQGAPGAPAGRGGGMMMRADTNGDGKVSQAEFTAMMDQRFTRLDKNGDGFIAADEVSDMPNRGPGGGVMAADADHDGKVSHAEFTTMATARFAKFDMNGDGQITPDEMSAPRN